MRWNEAPREGAGRHIRLDLSALDAGSWTIELRVRAPDGGSATARRVIEVR